MKLTSVVTLSCFMLAPALSLPCHGDEQSEIEQLKKTVEVLQQQLAAMQAKHEAEIEALKAQIENLHSQALPSAQDAALEKEFAEALAEEKPAPAGFLAKTSQALDQLVPTNFMDISANVDTLGHLNSREDTDIDDEWRVREVELGFSGAVDPYGKFNIFIGMHPELEEHAQEEVHIHELAPRVYHLEGLEAFEDSVNAIFDWYDARHTHHQHETHHDHWGLHVEEAYFTFDTLPHNLQLRLGKFRPDFGKANTLHRHALPWVDYPRVVEYYFGEEGLSGTGASLSWLIPNPWDHYAELTYQTFKNDSDALFAGEDADDLAHLLHFRNFWDLSPSSTFELGLTGATAPNDAGHGQNRTWLEGIDLTYKWRPLREGLYKSFAWHSEAFLAQKDVPGSPGREDTWGVYSAADYQFARRLALGLRYDYAEWPDDRREFEHDYSTYLTFKQSEFAYWRLGYMHRNMSYGSKYDDDELFLQFNVSLGAHPPHEY